ncbi:tRNA uridine-5-carboxymethylaminomethyl(34) synthesis GTPase MnmE [Altererythrobacter sp. CAU 1778]
MDGTDTIFALSSGAPPAAIGIVRLSGPRAIAAAQALAGAAIEPRRASLRTLRAANGEVLDEALVLVFPGPASPTGEDCAELHCHGGRAVIAAVTAELARHDGLRQAREGEFTRRAFTNGRLDLAEAEGLSDLLFAETELQRRAAMANSGGQLSRQIEARRSDVLRLSALVEAALDFSDEDDVGDLPPAFTESLQDVVADIDAVLALPAAERLRDGFRVVLAGPPNVGKSSLFNAILADDAAIVSPTPGTTRDLIERSVAIGGVPFTFVDSAGMRGDVADEIEGEGVRRSGDAIANADCVLWLGDPAARPDNAWLVASKIDLGDSHSQAEYRVSSVTGEGIAELVDALRNFARQSFSGASRGSVNTRQRGLLVEARICLNEAASSSDLLITGEYLRSARSAFDRVVGRASTEDMLDTLFGGFCIGK